MTTPTDESGATHPGRTHVAHVSTVHGWQDNRIFRRHARTLARHGYRVTLLATGTPPPGPVDGVEVVARPRRGGRVRRLLVDLPATLVRALRLRADVYHLHDPELGLLIPILRARGAAVIYDAHEDLPSQVLAKSYLPGPLAAAAPALARALCAAVDRTASAVVAATGTVGARFDPRHTTVVHNYPEILDTDAGAPGAAPPGPSVVYVGRISETRGALTMLDAFGDAGLPAEWTLTLVGPYASVALHERLARHPAWSRVDERGQVSPLAAREQVARARIGLAVLKSTPAYRDALPTKLFEYMAAGVPVVASDFPLWREIVDGAGCGLLVDPDDPRALAEALARLAGDPEEAAAMGERGRRAVHARYTWTEEEKQLLAAYAALDVTRTTASARRRIRA